MKIYLGDKVQLLDSKEVGTVIQIHGENLTLDIEGFEYEVSIHEVIILNDKASKKTQNPNIDEKVKNLAEGFYLVIDTEQHWLSLYLLNQTASYLHFVVIQKNHKKEYLVDGILEPFKMKKIRTVSEDHFNKEAHLEFQFLSCYKNHPENNQLQTIDFDPTTKILKKKRTYLHHLQKEVIVHPIYLVSKSNEKKTGIPVYLKTSEETFETKEIELREEELVFDLHIEKLVDNPQRFSQGAILPFQLKKAEEFMALAIQKKCIKVTFIHGSGKGKLKEELIELFKNYPFVVRYASGDIQKYGLGATTFELKHK